MDQIDQFWPSTASTGAIVFLSAQCMYAGNGPTTQIHIPRHDLLRPLSHQQHPPRLIWSYLVVGGMSQASEPSFPIS
jgi:hypothetical protein